MYLEYSLLSSQIQNATQISVVFGDLGGHGTVLDPSNEPGSASG